MNEEANLSACLSSLSWCDDIVVLDSGSSDRTLDIARAHGARIITRPFDNFANQRNFGLDCGQFRHAWVLHLDADEISTPDFRAAISSLVPVDGVDAYNIPSKMMLFGRWMKHAGMYPAYQVRLGHRDRLRFLQVGHGQQEDLPPERLRVLDVPYLHYSFSHGLFDWLQKHTRYARDEAALIEQCRQQGVALPVGHGQTSLRRWAKANAARLPVAARPALRFFYVYFLKQGFRDGRAGFAYALMLAVYEGMTAVLVLEAALERSAVLMAPRMPPD